MFAVIGNSSIFVTTNQITTKKRTIMKKFRILFTVDTFNGITGGLEDRQTLIEHWSAAEAIDEFNSKASNLVTFKSCFEIRG